MKKSRVLWALFILMVFLVGIVKLKMFADPFNASIPIQDNSSDKVIQTARQYLKSNPVIYVNDRRVSAEDERFKRLKWDPTWFDSHAPRIYFYPDKSSVPAHLINRQAVLWHWIPGCTERDEKYRDGTPRPHVWRNSLGIECVGGHTVSVVITPAGVPERVDVQSLQ